ALDVLDTRARVHAEHTPASTVQIPYNFAHAFIRGDDLTAHDWLQQYWFSLLTSVSKSQSRGDLEGDFGGFSLAKATVDQNYPDIHNGKSGKNSCVQSFYHTLFHRANE